MKKVLGYAILAVLVGCGEKDPSPRSSDRSPSAPSLVNAERVVLWATNYYLLSTNEIQNGIPLRNMNNVVIGPSLSHSKWCDAAVQGSVRVSGVTYSYAGKRAPKQANCRLKTSETVRWNRTNYRYGKGSNNNPLIPFKTVACDLGSVPESKPWTSNGFPKFGQKIFIPKALGTKLDNGRIHNGIFICGDVGRKITGNHIDVFVGEAAGRRDALAKNPFDFVGHEPNARFEAFLLK